eukprot:COSAG06_NODE_948_length_11359_cov_6.236146_3_plen_137_part_00
MECALREHAVIIGTTGRITLEPAHAPTQLTVITDQGIDGYPGAEEKAEAEEENNRTANHFHGAIDYVCAEPGWANRMRPHSNHLNKNAVCLFCFVQVRIMASTYQSTRRSSSTRRSPPVRANETNLQLKQSPSLST